MRTTARSQRRDLTVASLNPDVHDGLRREAIRLATLLVTLAISPATPPAADSPASVYGGSGAWVDRYDFEQLEGADVVIPDMATRGVRTLYIETASWRVPNSVDIVAPQQTEELLMAAHAYGMKVVAWYLPGFANLRTDMRRVRAALEFTTEDGQKFDSFALDIEANSVNPVWRRNAAMLKLSRMIRDEVGPDYELGAIVPDQLSTSDGNVLWPSFPYAATAKYYDVFLPMAYSTFNRARGASRVYRYTANNVRFVQRATGKPVHVIGGITNEMSLAEERAVERAAEDTAAIGASMYKYVLG